LVPKGIGGIAPYVVALPLQLAQKAGNFVTMLFQISVIEL
jgi:hypothetical protein